MVPRADFRFLIVLAGAAAVAFALAQADRARARRRREHLKVIPGGRDWAAFKAKAEAVLNGPKKKDPR